MVLTLVVSVVTSSIVAERVRVAVVTSTKVLVMSVDAVVVLLAVQLLRPARAHAAADERVLPHVVVTLDLLGIRVPLLARHCAASS